MFLLMGSKRAYRRIGFQIASYCMTPMTVDFKNRNSAVAARDSVGQKREGFARFLCMPRKMSDGCDLQVIGRAEFQARGCAVEEQGKS